MVYELETLFVAAISGIAAIAIAVFAIIQASSAKTQAEASKTQTDLMKKEIDSRLRPWIAPETFTPFHRYFKDGRGLSIEDTIQLQLKDKSVEIDSTVYKLTIKNWGSLPAKVSYRYIHGDSIITKEGLKNSEKNEEHQFMPHSEDGLYPNISEEINAHGKSYWVGIEIEYVVNKQISLAGKIWKLYEHKISLEDNWWSGPHKVRTLFACFFV